MLVASADGTRRKETVHLEGLQSFLSLRYATGNGSTDLVFRLDGRSVVAPLGPLAIKAEARVRGTQTHFTLDGQLLGGTVQARGDVDSQHLEAADALVAIAIPRTELGGYGWGPLRVDGEARPGAIPKLDLLLAIPGLELTAKGGGRDTFKLEARLALDDLARTGRAAQVLTTAVVPSMAGHGDLRLTVEGPLAGAPVGWSAGCKGSLQSLAVRGEHHHGPVDRRSRGPAREDSRRSRSGRHRGVGGRRNHQARQDRARRQGSPAGDLLVGEPGVARADPGGVGGAARRRPAGTAAVAALALLSESGVGLGRRRPAPFRATEGLPLGPSPSRAGAAAGRRRGEGRRAGRRARCADQASSRPAADAGRPPGPQSGRDGRPRRQSLRRGGRSQGGRAGGAGRGTLPDLFRRLVHRSMPRWPTSRSTAS